MSLTVARDVRSPIAAYLGDLLERHAATDAGEVATYIPELAGVDPDLFGICLATVDGAVYEAGDTGAWASSRAATRSTRSASTPRRESR